MYYSFNGHYRIMNVDFHYPFINLTFVVQQATASFTLTKFQGLTAAAHYRTDVFQLLNCNKQISYKIILTSRLTCVQTINDSLNRAVTSDAHSIFLSICTILSKSRRLSLAASSLPYQHFTTSTHISS